MVINSGINAGEYQVSDFSASEYDDKVIMHGDWFKELYGNPRYSCETENIDKLLCVIKISTSNGKSIHRSFFGRKGVKGLDKGKIALSPNSIRLLTEKNGNVNPNSIDTVIISQGSKFKYFWNHPYHATRISMRLGFWSIVLAMAGIAVSLISCLFK